MSCVDSAVCAGCRNGKLGLLPDEPPKCEQDKIRWSARDCVASEVDAFSEPSCERFAQICTFASHFTHSGLVSKQTK